MIIGLTGTNGAGKGTVAEILKEKGFEYHSLSDELREELKRRGVSENRDALIALGNELREKEGPGTLAKRMASRIRKSKKDSFVIDSIRNPAEIEELRKNKSFILLAVDADIGLRYERVTARSRPGDSNLTFEHFKSQEQTELSGGKNSQQLLKCMGMADIRVINEGSIEELKEKVESILKKYD